MLENTATQLQQHADYIYMSMCVSVKVDTQGEV